MNKIANYNASIGNTVRRNNDITDVNNLELRYPEQKTIVWNNNYDFTIDNFDAFPNAKLFVNWGTATSNLPDAGEFSKRGIQLETVKGYCTKAVSEYIIKMLMELFSRSPPVREELSEKKIGIIGLGSIGQDVAKILENGFNCDINYYSRSKKDTRYKYKDLNSIVSESDALVISVDSKSFRIPNNLLQNAKEGLKIANISQDFILPAVNLINDVRSNILPSIDIISDNFNKTEGYDKYFSPHVAYKTKESIENKNILLQCLIDKYGK